MKYGPEIYRDPDVPIDIHIYMEHRKSVRIAMLKTKVNLRMPILISTAEKEKYIEWGVNWVKNKIKKTNGRVLSQDRIYEDGDVLHVMGRTLLIHITELRTINTASGSLKGQAIYIKLPADWEASDQQDACRNLVRKCLCRELKSAVAERVHILNQRHFQKKINEVRLKYNVSNWGSCSKRGNINLSLRLLFAPMEVVDYVIIHELSHLLELNHSPRFWSIVEKADPTYRAKEKWLKEHSYEAFV